MIPAAFIIGVVFLLFVAILVVYIPNPTRPQFEVFKILIALGGASFAMGIVGFIAVRLNLPGGGFVVAGGAIAVFVILFFFSPASSVVPPPKPVPKLNPGDPPPIVLNVPPGTTITITTPLNKPPDWNGTTGATGTHPTGGPSLPLKQYTVYVVNRSHKWKVLGLKIGNDAIKLDSPIGATCEGSCEDCMKATSNYKPLYRIDCITHPFDLYVIAESVDGHFYQSNQAAHIAPSCQEDGTVLCADFPEDAPA
jgi:hypothetical protein